MREIITTAKAIEILDREKYGGAIGKRHRRVHGNTAVKKNDIFYALNGCCGSCDNLTVYIHGKAPNGFTKMGLDCAAHLAPEVLFENGPHIIQLTCAKFVRREKI